ncbi:serine/threonine-protein phosphatase 7 long form homolog [Gossypium raimondii]|uniref:serine/threonine-protein phosphatase 7 long form homolog n=1 Tax=Gossypium raimondii TaxID=29730 RepID=UPI00227A03E4|nr:serine/threonine-protein phosphatase 7 long form homolog [Gossypium raimondii]
MMPFLVSVGHQVHVFPLMNRWYTCLSIEKSEALIVYRQMIEAYTKDRFMWMSYITPDVASVIPPSTRAYAIVWCINAPIINIQMVEWYARDQVLHQFGCRQHIPDVPIQLGKYVHKIDKKGKHAKNWALEHQPYIVLWNVRLERRPYLESCFPNFTPLRGYQ